MKRKVGRPVVPRRAYRQPGISVRLSADERKTVDMAVQHSGLSLSIWARKTLLDAAKSGSV
jgi:hypothetical protein